MPEKAPQNTESRHADKYIVRFPEGMRDRLKAAAQANKRTLNAEVVSRLEASFQVEDESTSQRVFVTSVGDGQGRHDWLAMRGDVLKSRIEGLMLREHILKDSAMRISEKPQTDDDQARLKHIHSQLVSLQKDLKALTLESDELADAQRTLKVDSKVSHTS